MKSGPAMPANIRVYFFSLACSPGSTNAQIW